jgi:predicted peptidase
MTGISIEVDNADVSLGCFHDGSHKFPDPTFIKETRNGKSVALAHADAPARSSKGEEVVAIHYRSSGADYQPKPAKPRPPTKNEHYVKDTFKTRSGVKIGYWFMTPGKTEAGRKYPLVLALHGLAGNATAATELGTPELREQFPCFVMAPVSTADGFWATPFAEQNKDGKATLPVALEAMDAFIETHPIDPDRIYVTGQSMGGAGTYNAMHYRPDVFAAAIPVCGLSNPGDKNILMKRAIWMHKSKVAWRTQGNHPSKALNYRNSGEHCSGANYASREVWQWLFQQQRTP